MLAVPTAMQVHDCVCLYQRGLERLPSMGAEILLEMVLKDYLKSPEEICLYPVCWDDMVADEVTTAQSLMKSKGRPRKHKR